MLQIKIQEKFEKVWSQFVEVVAFFFNFDAICSHVKEDKTQEVHVPCRSA